MHAAACNEADPELWFPEVMNMTQTRPALEVCAECPVKVECLEFAIENHCWDGIFGGRTPKERRIIAEAHGIRIHGYKCPLAPHGTLAAARRHYRQGTPLCEACRERTALEQEYGSKRRRRGEREG